MEMTATYICPACGEEIEIPIDPTQGARQEFIEDCPVCCRPIVLHLECDPEGHSYLRAELE